MSNRKTAASRQHRRYGCLIARTAVLCPKATEDMEFDVNAITASNYGHWRGCLDVGYPPYRHYGRLIAHTAALWSEAACV